MKKYTLKDFKDFDEDLILPNRRLKVYNKYKLINKNDFSFEIIALSLNLNRYSIDQFNFKFNLSRLECQIYKNARTKPLKNIKRNFQFLPSYMVREKTKYDETIIESFIKLISTSSNQNFYRSIFDTDMYQQDCDNSRKLYSIGEKLVYTINNPFIEDIYKNFYLDYSEKHPSEELSFSGYLHQKFQGFNFENADNDDNKQYRNFRQLFQISKREIKIVKSLLDNSILDLMNLNKKRLSVLKELGFLNCRDNVYANLDFSNKSLSVSCEDGYANRKMNIHIIPEVIDIFGQFLGKEKRNPYCIPSFRSLINTIGYADSYNEPGLFNIKRIIEYLYFDYHEGYGKNEELIATEYRDYLNMAIRLLGESFNIKNKKYLDLYPTNLKKAHDNVSDELRNFEYRQLSEEEKKKWRTRFAESIKNSPHAYIPWKETKNSYDYMHRSYNEKDKGRVKRYCVVVPQTPEDIILEGQFMHHCVGSYVSSIIHNETHIMFLRDLDQPDNPLVTIELLNSGRDNDKQMKYVFNQIYASHDDFLPASHPAIQALFEYAYKYNFTFNDLSYTKAFNAFKKKHEEFDKKSSAKEKTEFFLVN